MRMKGSGTLIVTKYALKQNLIKTVFKKWHSLVSHSLQVDRILLKLIVINENFHLSQFYYTNNCEEYCAGWRLLQFRWMQYINYCA